MTTNIEEMIDLIIDNECYLSTDDYRNFLRTTLTTALQQRDEEWMEICDKRVRSEAQAHVKRKIAHGKAMYEKGKNERD